MEPGDAPEDTGLVTQTYISTHNAALSLALDPANYNTIFHEDIYSGGGGSGTYGIRKYTWVPNDLAVQDLNWGSDGNGETSWTLTGYDYDIGSPFTIDSTTLMSAIGCGDSNCMDSYLIFIDMQTGDEIRRMDTSNRFVNQRPDGAWRNRTPCDFSLVNGVLSLVPHYSIFMSAVNPLADNQEEFWLWDNRDGDNFHDHYSESTTFSQNPVYQYVYGGRQDANNFLTTPTYDMGSVTFDCTAPDGTGIGVFALAGEVAGLNPIRSMWTTVRHTMVCTPTILQLPAGGSLVMIPSRERSQIRSLLKMQLLPLSQLHRTARIPSTRQQQ